MHSRSQSGFTLIELLVVIAIIGILASTALASLNDARASANFTKMKQDMRQIATAAELFAIKNQQYPCDVAPDLDPGSLDVSTIYPGEVGRFCSSDETLVAGGYLPEWPTPPCEGWTYDWENWGPAVLPTGTGISHIVRVSMRTSTAGVPNVYYYCIKDTHDSEDYTCGGREGDVITTLGGQEITQLSGGLYCNVPD